MLRNVHIRSRHATGIRKDGYVKSLIHRKTRLLIFIKNSQNQNSTLNANTTLINENEKIKDNIISVEAENAHVTKEIENVGEIANNNIHDDNLMNEHDDRDSSEDNANIDLT